VVPYLLFQVLYACYFEFSGRDQDWGLDHLLTPLYHLWFLPALFLWRMLAPLLRRLRFAMAGAVALSLATGTMTAFGPALAVNRVMALLPFFVFGMLYGTRTVRWLASIPFVKIAAAVTLTVGLVAAAVVHAELPVPWLYWTASYEALHVDLVHGMAIRAGLLCLALVLACALLALVPRGHSALTGIGRRSMCPYLFHAFVTLAFAWSTYRPTRWWEIACLCAGAVALTALLGSRWVSRALRMLVDPQLAWLFRRDDRSAGLPGTASVDTGTDHGGVGAGRRDVGSIPVGSGGPHRDRVAGAVDGTFGSSAIGRRPSRVAAMAES
jgi:fucose 4-O-acetylase-like acetyltransferase